MRPIVTAGAATSMLALVIVALQQQHQTTRDSLPSVTNSSGSWEAFNTTSTVFGDLTTPLASGLPLALIAAFVASVFAALWVVGGR